MTLAEGAVMSLALIVPMTSVRLGTVEFMRPEPDPATYGRVTNPDRYRVVVDEAEALVTKLVAGFDVTQGRGTTTVDFQEWIGAVLPTVRLVPRQGVPITFAWTSFPGVLARFGSCRESFPSCGCDACDENPVGEAERLIRLTETAVDGRYEEELTRRRLRCSFAGTWGNKSSVSRLRRGEWRRYGDRGVHRWPPWPARG